MARQLRVEFPGAIYHVAVQMLGDWKKETNLLFEDDRDRERLLDRLGDRVEQYHVRLCRAEVLEVEVDAFRQRRRDSCLRGGLAVPVSVCGVDAAGGVRRTADGGVVRRSVTNSAS
jgi:hypothetical protein